MGRSLERGRASVVAIAGLAIVGCSLTALDGFDADDPSRPGENSQTQGTSGGPGSSSGSSGSATPGAGTSGSGTSGTSGSPGPGDPSRDAGPDGPTPPSRTGNGSCLTPYKLGLGLHVLPGCAETYPEKCGTRLPILRLANELPTAKVSVEGPGLWHVTTPACSGPTTTCTGAAGVSKTLTSTSELVAGKKEGSGSCGELRVLVELE